MEGRKGESLEELRRFQLPFVEIIHYSEPADGCDELAETERTENVRMLERQMTADAAALCDAAGHTGIYRRAMGLQARHVKCI